MNTDMRKQPRTAVLTGRVAVAEKPRFNLAALFDVEPAPTKAESETPTAPPVMLARVRREQRLAA